MSGAGVDPACAAWVRERITFLGTHSDLWNAEHDETVADFLSTSSQRRLLAWLDPILGLSLQTSLPQEAVGELHYFIKASGLTVTAENINDTLQYGVARGSAVGSLLRVMSGVFVPLCLSDQSWPDTIKKEFSGQMHKFMASLTETAWDAHGKTVLYIPLEDIGAPEVAAKQKHLVRVGLVPSAPGLSSAVDARAELTAAPRLAPQVQRLNSTLIHWTRQIKEVVNRQDDGDDGDDAGPLAEVHFWSSRTIDLSGIHEQLERPGVAQIVQALEAAKSSYLKPFLELSRMIQMGHEEAIDNLKFLQNLTAPCESLAAASPEEIPALLPSILHVIRLIWRYSRFYNSPERITGLLRKARLFLISGLSSRSNSLL